MSRKVGIVAALFVLTVVPSARAEFIVGLTTNNQIVRFDSATPGNVSAPIAVTGVTGTLVGIDFRPADGTLVAVGRSGTTGQVYTVNTTTGAATAVGGMFTLNASPNNSSFGVDFNPVPNALRILSNDNPSQNLRITAGGTGTVNTDTALTIGGAGGVNPLGAAYSNNNAGVTQTTLYDLVNNGDGGPVSLYTQGSVNGSPTSPNLGQLFLVGALGQISTNEVGFDISGATGVAFASLTTSSGSSLYTINLGTGAATLVGGIDSGLILRDISVVAAAPAVVPVPEPASMALFAGMGAMLVAARRRRK